MFKHKPLPDAVAFGARVRGSLDVKIKDIVWPGLTDAVRLDQEIGRRLAKTKGQIIDPPVYSDRVGVSDEYSELGNALRYSDYLVRLARTVIGADYALRIQSGIEKQKSFKWKIQAPEVIMVPDQNCVQPRMYVVQ